MSSGAKRNRDISGFIGRLRFLVSLGMTLGLGEIFNTQVLTVPRRVIESVVSLFFGSIEQFVVRTDFSRHSQKGGEP